MAEALGELGAKVAITARKPNELDEAGKHLSAMGIEALPIVCDMADLAAIPPMVERVIATLGPVDILINNAGTAWGAATVDHTLEAWNKVMTLNLTAMFVVTQEVGRRCMVPRKQGKIINITSIQGLTGFYPETAATLAYNTSKGGVVNFTRTLAYEWAQYNINVNAIAPGFFPTKMTKAILSEMGDETANLAPLKRVGGPEDLKGITAVFASDACAFITGQTIAIDGGLTAI
jgi:gluconate 5-dehydrogenase